MDPGSDSDRLDATTRPNLSRGGQSEPGALEAVQTEKTGTARRASPRKLDRGDTIGRFVVLYRLGRGGSGEVYAAYDPQLERKVAIKLLHEPDREILIREAQAMARLRHPNVVTVYDLHQAEGRSFLSMAYIEGENLAQLVARRPPEKAWAVEMGRQIANGLAVAHQLGILHRDLKPANVLVDRDGQAHIADFGLAGLRQRELGAGTPAYMSPEQRAGRGVSRKSDVYSLGWLLYELFTGERPSPDRVRRPPPRRLPGLEAATESVVLRCLAPDPEERPAADEVEAALALELRRAQHRAFTALERLQRRRRSALAIAGAALLFAMVMGYQTRRIAQEARRAESAAMRARDVARLTVASEWMTKDPTYAALALLEIERPEETTAVRAKVRAVLSQPLTVLEMRDHGGRIYTVDWSADGERLVTASADRTARIWQADGSGHRILRHGERLWSARWSPDDEQVLTTTQEGNAYLWSAKRSDAGDTDRPARELRGHRGRIWGVDWSPDGKRVATASDDGTVRIWRTRGDSGASPIVLHHDGAVFRSDWDGSGERLVSASYDGTARVWSLTGTDDDPAAKVAVLAAGAGIVFSAAFLPGDRVATAHQDGSVRLWRLAEPGRELAEPFILRGHDSSVYGTKPSPDGAYLLTGSLDGTARVWRSDGSRHDPVLILRTAAGQVAPVSFSRDGELAAAAADDAVARVWEIGALLPLDPAAATRTVDVAIELRGHDAQVMETAIDPRGERVATVSLDGALRIWDVRSGYRPRLLGRHGGRVHSARWSRDGRRIVTSSDDGTARVWHPDSPAPAGAVLQGHGAQVYAAAWSPDGRRVATASRDDTVRVWTPDGDGTALILRGHRNTVKSVAWAPDGERIVSGGDDGTVRIWPVGGPSGSAPSDGGSTILTTWEAASPASEPTYGPTAWTAVAWGADGRIAAGSDDGRIRLWSQEGGRLPQSLVHDSPVTGVAWGPDGRMLAVSYEDGTARVWSVDPAAATAWDLLGVLADHDGHVASVAFDSRGERLITASWDGTARVWPVPSAAASETSAGPIVIEGLGGAVAAASFSPDGRRVVLGSDDGTVRVWRLEATDLTTALGAATRVCLPQDFRHKSLGEEPAEARRRYQECERSHGRRPLPPRHRYPL